jgi:hypothetical protein
MVRGSLMVSGAVPRKDGGRTRMHKPAYTMQIVEPLERLAGDLLAEGDGDAAVLVLGLLDELEEVHAEGLEPVWGR